MLPQIHFNFGPTAFDRFYQLSLPIIPGGVFMSGLLQARPDLFISLPSAVALHPYASFAVFVFAAYVAGSYYSESARC